jgi:hypothetical protein
MEVAAGLIKLNPDSESKVDEWRDTMKSRMDEALATLVHEGAQIEGRSRTAAMRLGLAKAPRTADAILRFS